MLAVFIFYADCPGGTLRELSMIIYRSLRAPVVLRLRKAEPESAGKEVMHYKNGRNSYDTVTQYNYDGTKTVTKRTYKYKKFYKKTRLAKLTEASADKTVNLTQTFTYYKNGLVKKAVSKSGSGDNIYVSYSDEYKYRKGKEVYCKHTNLLNKETSTTKTSYNKKGFTSKIVAVTGDYKTTEAYSYKYYKKKFIKQEIVKENGKYSTKTVYSNFKAF